MKNNITRLAAILTVLMLLLSIVPGALAVRETVSGGFSLPAVKARPTAVPTEAPTEEPAEEPSEAPTAQPEKPAQETLPVHEEDYIPAEELPTVAPDTELKELHGPHTGMSKGSLRAEPDGLSVIIATVPVYTEVTILSYVNEDWAEVSYEGMTGYMHRTDLEGASFPAAQVPEGETPQIKVTIFTSRTSVLEPGETITLTSLVENAEEYHVAYQWECDKGSGFTAVSGAESDSYSFTADVESLSWDWRLGISCTKD